MQDMKIISGGWEVLANGYVSSNGMNPLDFELTKNMILRLIVVPSPEEDPSIDLEPEGIYLKVIYTNPKKITNFGTKDPIEIGLYNGRTLFVQTRISIFGDYTSFSAAYTFYLGAKRD